MSELFILSAPSAAGKTTLIRRLLSRRDLSSRLAFAVSHTTRPPRRGEVDGRDYYFVARQEFDRLIAADAFLEWAVVHGENRYGTSREEVERLLLMGVDVLLDIDVQGAEQLRRREPRIPSIFILPPSYEELERRLKRRALDHPEEIERRLRTARAEIRCHESYDYVIVNDDLDRASEALAAIFLSRRCRRDRMQTQIERVLDGFPPPGA